MLWNPKGGLRHESNLGSDATNIGTSVTTGASASTKGAVAQAIASTLFDAYLITICTEKVGSPVVASQSALDILIGAATETVLIPDLLAGYALGKLWMFPLYIPAGSRISLQMASARTSTTFGVRIHLYGGHGYPPFRVGAKVTTLGMGTVPNGTAITPGASGAAGAWAEMSASTPDDYFALLPSFQVAVDTTTSQLRQLVDVGIGAAASEQVIDTYLWSETAEEYMTGPSNPFPTYRDIPVGSRLALRASNSGANDSSYNGVIHCVN